MSFELLIKAFMREISLSNWLQVPPERYTPLWAWKNHEWSLWCWSISQSLRRILPSHPAVSVFPERSLTYCDRPADVPLYSTAARFPAYAQELPPPVKAPPAQGHFCPPQPWRPNRFLWLPPCRHHLPAPHAETEVCHQHAIDEEVGSGVVWGSMTQNFLRQGSKVTCCSHISCWGAWLSKLVQIRLNNYCCRTEIANGSLRIELNRQ